RINVRGCLASNLAAILQLPARTGRMLSDHFIFPVVKFGIGSFERPSELAVGGCFAGVNLRSGCMRVKDNLIARRNLNRVRDVGRSLLLRSVLLAVGEGKSEKKS